MRRPATKKLAAVSESGSDNTLSIRVTVECKPGVSRARAEQIARSIQRYAEKRPGVSHAYEREVYNADDLELDDA